MNTPYFLWDYNLTDGQIRGIIHGPNETEKLWIIGRILSHARFEDVWKYLTIDDIVSTFSKLKLPPNSRQAWERALTVWGYHVKPS